MVYSSEVPSDDLTLLPLANSELAMGSMDKLAPQRNFRVRILPVHSPLSAFFDPCVVSLLLTTADVGLFYDDFALGRSIVPPACMRAGIEEVSRTISRVFAMPGEDAVYEEIVCFNRVQGYVDALGEPIDPALFDNGSLSGAPRRRGGIFAIGHSSNISHFWMSTKH
ncbi:hypothetical protein BGW80DRAFT_1458523 [Lactifluus volemus]|nr:hypothetical protein BGW80DRAFT_1458523 [Lactifluus volemus]